MNEPTTIDLTPTWAGILPALIAVIREGTTEGRHLALEEMRRMADAADRFNQLAKEIKP